VATLEAETARLEGQVAELQAALESAVAKVGAGVVCARLIIGYMPHALQTCGQS
jgi:microcompartment protein CcmL/EutN